MRYCRSQHSRWGARVADARSCQGLGTGTVAPRGGMRKPLEDGGLHPPRLSPTVVGPDTSPPRSGGIYTSVQMLETPPESATFRHVLRCVASVRPGYGFSSCRIGTGGSESAGGLSGKSISPWQWTYPSATVGPMSCSLCFSGLFSISKRRAKGGGMSRKLRGAVPSAPRR